MLSSYLVARLGKKAGPLSVVKKTYENWIFERRKNLTFICFETDHDFHASLADSTFRGMAISFDPTIPAQRATARTLKAKLHVPFGKPQDAFIWRLPKVGVPPNYPVIRPWICILKKKTWQINELKWPLSIATG